MNPNFRGKLSAQCCRFGGTLGSDLEYLVLSKEIKTLDRRVCAEGIEEVAEKIFTCSNRHENGIIP
jgi:hypothetical protein